ncbi:hypothetical protein IFM89_026551 [Coptis chinensis]|uniref:Uncharacterized protein n=1 Tax=Coptis chinensis TaxID=261450 RepID=A0A835LNX0_9MAGN|nr:hypothetical protein IFM89_026551 [Coptis chinensis]
MSSSSGAGKTVCVTGASGYIASWLVKLLLERGYTVKASVRDPNDSRKTEHLRRLPGANDRLHLFKANLVDEGCFDSIINGCEGVFHTASPCFFKAADPQRWYALSKTLAEESAWKFAKEHGIDLVTIHPAFVIGPLLQPTLNSSTEIILNLINGIQTDIYSNLSFGWVDVKDVANAHILAFEVPSAHGRYCIVGKYAHCSEIVKILRELYPQIQHPEKDADDKPFVPDYNVSKEKAKSLGTDFIPLEVSLKETVESFKEKKLVSF